MDRERTAGQIERIARHWEEHGYGMWAVEGKASDEFIGRIGLMRYADFQAEPEGSRQDSCSTVSTGAGGWRPRGS
jgi:RimJ/RimL family protein N-acetyltransferase